MRQNTQIVLLVCLVMVLGYWGYQWRFSDEGGTRLVVVSSSGLVERTDGAGVSQPTETGVEVDVQDTLTTGADGLVMLRAGEGSQLSLSAKSTMRVVSVDAGGVRVELENGRVSARVRAGAPALGITNRGRAVNATDADFTIVVDPEGAFGVETERGSVGLQGFDEVVQLQAGHRLQALPGREPVSAPVSSALLLKVDWPEGAVTRSAEVTIRGRTDPYASVVLGDGTSVRAGADGKFRAKVALKEGENDLKIRVRDVMGRETDSKRTFTRDSTAPSVQSTEVLWGQ
jgi:hypothetical protein